MVGEFRVGDVPANKQVRKQRAFTRQKESRVFFRPLFYGAVV
jgi:hypothetical protein